jgi:hypothetical protein
MVALAKKKPAKKSAKPKAEKKPKAAKVKKPVKDAKAVEAELEKWRKEIEALEESCQTAEVEVIRTKREAKSAKEFYESQVDRLRAMVRASANDAKRPLFTHASLAEADGSAKKNEAWRDVEIEKLSCGAGIDKKLREAKFETIGKIADHTNAGKLIDDIPGIGPVAADTIRERLMQFWADHPEYIDDPKPSDGTAVNQVELAKTKESLESTLKISKPKDDFEREVVDAVKTAAEENGVKVEVADSEE